MRIVGYGARARWVVLLCSAAMIGGCGGGGDAASTLSACAPALAGDGSVTWPAMQTSSGTFQFTLTPAPTDDEPLQYTASLAPADASLGCAPIAFDPTSTSALVAGDVDRMGQLLTINFQQQPGSNGSVFRKTGGSVTGGLLNGIAGDDLNPLTGATVSVQDSAGHTLATGTTNDHGSLIVPIETLPDNFKVIAMGGTMFGKPFVGSLKAEVEGYTTIDANPAITLTPVTTIVAAMRERSPDLSLAEAMSRVKAQLQMPQRLDVDASDQGASDYFDSNAFYEAADAAGGVDALVQSVLSDWDQGVSHDFAVAGEIDLQEPTFLMKELVPTDQLPSFKQTAACDPATCMRPQVDVLGVVGKLKGFYDDYKRRQWESDVVANLNRINAELKSIKSELGTLKDKLNSVSYDLAFTKVDKWQSVVSPAFTALHWLANNPQKDYKPTNETCPDPPPAVKNRASLSAGCKRYADWLDRAAASVKAIKTVTKPFDPEVDEDVRDLLIEFRGKPMERYREALAGKKSVAGDIVGMLQAYRSIVYERRAGLGVADKRLFFRSEDSEDIWEHYRYWESQQAIAYLFIADFLASTGQDSEGSALQAAYTAALAAEKAAMPLRQMPKFAVIDPFNKLWNGSPVTGAPINGVAVGGPMMWMYPTQTSPCGPGLTYAFDTDNVQIQVALKTFFNCMNTNSTAGKGLVGWRMPTYLEWQAFTLTSGTPNSQAQGFPTVGDWMAERGFTMRGFTNTLVYAAAPGCTDLIFYNNKYSPCSNFSVYFQLISGQWRPFIWFGRNHTPDRYAGPFPPSGPSPFPAGSGYVFPVRPVSPNEYW